MKKLEIYKPVKNEDDLGEWFLTELRKIVKNCDIKFEYLPCSRKLRFIFKPDSKGAIIVVHVEAVTYSQYLYPEKFGYMSLDFDAEKMARYTVINIVNEFQNELNRNYVRNYYGYAENGYLPQ